MVDFEKRYKEVFGFERLDTSHINDGGNSFRMPYQLRIETNSASDGGDYLRAFFDRLSVGNKVMHTLFGERHFWVDCRGYNGTLGPSSYIEKWFEPNGSGLALREFPEKNVDGFISWLKNKVTGKKRSVFLSFETACFEDSFFPALWDMLNDYGHIEPSGSDINFVDFERGIIVYADWDIIDIFSLDDNIYSILCEDCGEYIHGVWSAEERYI